MRVHRKADAEAAIVRKVDDMNFHLQFEDMP
jgi:hypothetical protein